MRADARGPAEAQPAWKHALPQTRWLDAQLAQRLCERAVAPCGAQVLHYDVDITGQKRGGREGAPAEEQPTARDRAPPRPLASGVCRRAAAAHRQCAFLRASSKGSVLCGC